MNCLPNFFIVGAAKAGTTSLSNYLSQHPQIYLPSLKEPKYFSSFFNKFPHQGPNDQVVDAMVVSDLAAYRTLYATAGNCLARGEASVDYLYFPGVAEKIHALIPNPKIIILLRNPVERAFSAYSHMVRDSREGLSFEAALHAEKQREEANWEFFWRYQEVGFYSHQVQRYLEVFGPELVSVFLFEDFTREPHRICQEIFSILAVDPNYSPDVSKRLNRSGKPRANFLHFLFNRQNWLKSALRPLLPDGIKTRLKSQVESFNLEKIQMNVATRRHLASVYRADILRLQELLGRDLSRWLVAE